MGMNLLPQDVLVMLKLALFREAAWTYNKVADEHTHRGQDRST